MIESPVIFTTKPLNTGSFSRRKYALSKLLTTTAIIPESALTIPLRLIWSIAKQRLPLLHPEPSMLRLTTGLMNGSRRLVRLICLGASFLASAGFFWFSTAICCLGSAFLRAAAGFTFGAAAEAEIFLTTILFAGFCAGLLTGPEGLAPPPCVDARAAFEAAACFCCTL